ncbi:glycerol-3-phosphate dehydrogenase [Melittangium boletus]|uniref:glycerol-3-phosphate dehydrogenase n=1 Tax=Melittangium boletus TaxID=83453 RepID=UPI003DA3C9DF
MPSDSAASVSVPASAVPRGPQALASLPAPQKPPTRAERLAALSSQAFDVLVIGGGVTGCGIARDAALRGLRVALVEREDFASGTSSRSSRLVHGGVRYLEHGHLGLVFESSIERYRLLKLAPHLVRPLAFVWPTYKGARLPRWKLAVGLKLYDALALFRNVRSSRALSVQRVREEIPGLRSDGLTGGARYYDAATDDARLTLANALSASEAGATVLNHAAVRGLVIAEGRAQGATVVDVLTGQELSVRARVIVSATGPWSDEIRKLDAQDNAPAVRGSKGVHIAVPRARLPTPDDTALTVLSGVDGRVMFILPAEHHTIIGTTETTTHAHPSEVRASVSDVDYLLASANGFFPDAKLVRDDVVSAWAGIRPLVASAYGAGGANSASREHAIHASPSGVLAISGGKLTTYRVMASDMVNAVEKALGTPHHKALTGSLPLPGGEFSSFDAEVASARAEVGREDVARHLVRAYGRRWRLVWELTRERPELAEPLAPGLPYVRAESLYGVSHEFVHTLDDLLVRRLKVAFETRDLGRAAARLAASDVASALGWTPEDIARQLADYERHVTRLFGIDPA